jgi:hypothetical protein
VGGDSRRPELTGLAADRPPAPGPPVATTIAAATAAAALASQMPRREAM